MRNKTWYWNLWWDFAYMFDLYKLNWIFTRMDYIRQGRCEIDISYIYVFARH